MDHSATPLLLRRAFLAAIGLYGLVAYVVGLGRREIAVRLALGAIGHSVVSLIVRNGLTLVLAGLVVGSVGAVVAGRSLLTRYFKPRQSIL